MDHLFPLQALLAINMPTSPRTKQLINRATSYNIFTNVSRNKRVWACRIFPVCLGADPAQPNLGAHTNPPVLPTPGLMSTQWPAWATASHHCRVQKISKSLPISSALSTGFSQLEMCFRPHKQASPKSLSTPVFPTASCHHITSSCFTHSAQCAWSFLEPHFADVRKCPSSTLMSLFPRVLCMFNPCTASLQNNFNTGHLYACPLTNCPCWPWFQTNYKNVILAVRTWQALAEIAYPSATESYARMKPRSPGETKHLERATGMLPPT